MKYLVVESVYVYPKGREEEGVLSGSNNEVRWVHLSLS